MVCFLRWFTPGTVVYSRQSPEDSAQAFITISVARIDAQNVIILALALFQLGTFLHTSAERLGIEQAKKDLLHGHSCCSNSPEKQFSRWPSYLVHLVETKSGAFLGKLSSAAPRRSFPQFLTDGFDITEI